MPDPRIFNKWNRIILLFAAVSGGILIHYSCKHKPVIPEKEVSFSREVQPIIAANCTQSGCHGSVNYNDFQLLTYDDLMADDRIVPYDAQASKIYKVITNSNPNNRMPPPPRQPLTNEQVQLIYIWIMQGAPNN